MTDPDVVAELEWFTEEYGEGTHEVRIANRARAEIVALRKSVRPAVEAIRDAARAEALEEAATLCQRIWSQCVTADRCAAAIRALKDKSG